MQTHNTIVKNPLAIRVLMAMFVSFVVSQPCDAELPVAKPHGKDHSSSLHSHPEAKPVVLPKGYLRAVKNAKDATAKNVSRDLTAILRSNDQIVWQRNPDSDQWRVLVATWTTHASYYKKPGTTYEDDYEIWVTAAPQLRKFCQSYQPGEGDPPLARRLEQLLGLPPNSGHKFVVELWVEPSALFRPSADPETTDYEAQLQFPDVSEYVAVSPKYKDWYQKSVRDRYEPKQGPPYPWTRLGYTYDWGNPETRVGLSEFVFRAGNEVTVHSVSTTEDYAKKECP